MSKTIEIVKLSPATSLANGYSGIIGESADDSRHSKSTGYMLKTTNRYDVTKAVMQEIARVTGKKRLSVWLSGNQQVCYNVNSDTYRVVVDDECVLWQRGDDPACTDAVAIADSMGY